MFSKFIYFLLAVAIIGIIGVFLFRSEIFASDLGGGDQKIMNLGGELGSKLVTVKIFDNNGKIEIGKNMFSNCSSQLSGFQKEAKIRGIINLETNNVAIEIVGSVGVHAENRQYFIVTDSLCPKPLVFVKDAAISYNIYSDEPRFLLQDFNADGITDVAAEYRNYDLDPVLDGTRDIYFYNLSNNQFEFNRSENFQYPAV